MVTKFKDLRGNPGLPLPALLAKKSSCCVSYCLVEAGNHRVQISISIYQLARGANLPPIVAWKALITVGSFSFSRSRLLLLHTLNLLLVHLYAYFQHFFPIISPSFASLYRDDIVVTSVEINACDIRSHTVKLVLFLLIYRGKGKGVWFFRESKMSGTVRA